MKVADIFNSNQGQSCISRISFTNRFYYLPKKGNAEIAFIRNVGGNSHELQCFVWIAGAIFRRSP
jgi:hypothetical protein